ncbi:MAG: metalloregulator ArsR/SmtB family transcription factor [Cyanobacteria bacterium CRU_2_1]|nr:metalloregulator ArsR/SmtB family transcription factor [Cyanobacteria bacterium CRU_2_1]
MSEINRKRLLLEQLASLAKALGHEYRLELLELIAQGERSVETLTQLMNLPIATVSQHLQQLRRSGLLTARKDGKYVYYRLADDEVLKLIGALRRVAERNLAEVQRLMKQYFQGTYGLEVISIQELLERLRSDTVVLLDVRPQDEYAAGHLPGAINIPLKDLEQRLQELPTNHDVIAYCRGPYCVLSHDAVLLLHSRGIKALRLEEGYPEWKAEGLPVDR